MGLRALGSWTPSLLAFNKENDDRQLRGRGANGHEAAWVAELDAGETIPLARPGQGPSDWRVAGEEWEVLDSDPVHVDIGLIDIEIPKWERRLVYADEVDL
jgi:hypothetical protein